MEVEAEKEVKLKDHERLVPWGKDGLTVKVGLQSLIPEGVCTFVVMKPWSWGKGRTLDEALKICNKERGRKAKDTAVIYIVLHTTDEQHKACGVDGGGNMHWGPTLQSIKIVTRL